MHKNEPTKETTPHATQITKHKPIDCVSRRTPFGETNIPEPINKILIMLKKIMYLFLPIITPTIKQTPENKPKCLLSVTSSVGNTSFNESAFTIDPTVKRRCGTIDELL
jgi:hypothetical protein